MTMRRLFLFCILLFGLFLLQAQPSTASAANDAWTGYYFSNSLMRGEPVLIRSDPNLHFYWGNGKPAPEINSTDYFSARWSRTVTLDKAQSVKFVVWGDDGYRVFVDGKVLINRVSGVPMEMASANTYLSPGEHVFYVEYYEHIGNATLDLQYYLSPPDRYLGTDIFNFKPIQEGHNGLVTNRYWKDRYFDGSYLTFEVQYKIRQATTGYVCLGVEFANNNVRLTPIAFVPDCTLPEQGDDGTAIATFFYDVENPPLETNQVYLYLYDERSAFYGKFFPYERFWGE